jgi:hypothetical protein
MYRTSRDPATRESVARFGRLNRDAFDDAPYRERYATHDPNLRPGPAVAAAYSVVSLLAGVWLVLAPSVLGYGDALADGRWNDTVVGVAIGLVALVRIASPTATAAASLVNVVLGAWLVAAPFVIGYGDVIGAGRATWNDIAVGIVVAVFALASWGVGSRRSSSATPPAPATHRPRGHGLDP